MKRPTWSKVYQEHRKALIVLSAAAYVRRKGMRLRRTIGRKPSLIERRRKTVCRFGPLTSILPGTAFKGKEGVST